MKNRFFLIVSLSLSLLGVSALADRIPMRSIEDATEASNASVTLPSSDSGTLYFRDCAACNVQPLRLSSNTKFYLGGAPVSFATLKSSVEKSKMTEFTIFYPPGGRDVTRIVAVIVAAK